MWKSILLLSIFLVLSIAKDSAELNSISDEGSALLSSTIPGDDEDYELSGSGDNDLLLSPSENNTGAFEFLDKDQDIIDDSDSYKDEPEVDYVNSYDNGSNTTIAIDMRKGENEKETSDGHSAENEEVTTTKVATVAVEKIEIDIDIDPSLTEDMEILENEILNEVDVDDRTKVEILEIKPTNKEDTDPSVPDPAEPEPPKSASLLNNNQFLAAIIVGGCVGLLLAVCVIAVFAYRLKKKDEGSYSLDDHKKLSSNYQYTQGQEYFA